MLEDSLFESQGRGKTRKPFTMAIAAVAHAVTITGLVLIPLLQTQAITLPAINLPLLMPRTKFPESPIRLVPVTKAQPNIQQYPQPVSDALITPTRIPNDIARVDDSATPQIAGFLPGGDSTAKTLSNIFGPKPGSIAPPEPVVPPLPPPPPIIKTERIKQGGVIQAANLIHEVNPIYPRLAVQSRVHGVVVLAAVISKDGTVESLRVISGHPLLNQAALDAVKQWLYRPTLLNGDPVEVETTITVTFTLQ
jgi:periplasmic protein TonB